MKKQRLHNVKTEPIAEQRIGVQRMSKATHTSPWRGKDGTFVPRRKIVDQFIDFRGYCEELECGHILLRGKGDCEKRHCAPCAETGTGGEVPALHDIRCGCRRCEPERYGKRELAHQRFEIDEICADCGLSHIPKNRQRLIAKMKEVGATPTEIQAEYSCFYPGQRMLYRDLAAIKGVKP